MSLSLCHATLEDAVLTISNDVLCRKWSLDEQGGLRPISFQDLRTGKEWIDPNREVFAILPEGELAAESREISLDLYEGKASVLEEASLTAVVRATGPENTLETRFQIFPGVASISIQQRCQGAKPVVVSHVQAEGGEPTGVELSDETCLDPLSSDILDCLPLLPAHVTLTAVTLRDQTDHHDELVSTETFLLHPFKGNRKFEGVLFALEDNETGEGLVIVKEAPLPHACPVASEPAFQIRGMTCVIKGQGTGGDELFGYRVTTLAYQGGAVGRIQLLQQWQRSLRSYLSGRDGVFLTNTWGDRSQDGRITEGFMLQEVKAAADLGANAVQIDDGWQKGTSANSVKGGGVWIGFWKADPEFWQPHAERLPHGLEPLIERAKELNMQFGLWFAPDSADEFALWKKDAECILDFYRTYGVRFIKIDGVKALTKKAERHLRAFFDYVIEGSDGEVIFDLDVTAEIRPGYWGMLNVGAVFVENRYSDWGHYWPHRTLRNLWSLGQWIDPVRLRMEFLNSQRNQDKYGGDALAPACYRPDALFATVLFASPLGWFEASNLSEDFRDEVAKLAHLRTQYADEWLTGTILPMGERPDGFVWTGFASVAQDRKSVTYVVFRELNACEECEFELPFDLKARSVERLAGQEACKIVEGKLKVILPEKLGYMICRVTVAG
ncbi:alpha-galactosidase [Kiritimatiellota bacterium B12222]|nr:alpha-galactosidase [Kiritimatiellota bacterium B12222]